jgi:hypothetical protein
LGRLTPSQAAASGTADIPAGSVFVDYPTHIKLWGVSASTGLPGGVTLAGEYSYRSNQPLQLPLAEVLLAMAGYANQLTGTDPAVANEVPYGTEISGFRRVGCTSCWRRPARSSGRRWAHRNWRCRGNRLYPPRPSFQPQIRGAGVPFAAARLGRIELIQFDVDRLLRHRELLGLSPCRPHRLRQRVDGGTVTPYVAFAHDVSGVGPTFNEGVKALTLGVSVSYLKQWQGQVAYTSYFGGKTYSGIDVPNASSGPLPPGQSARYSSGANPLRDRDFLAVSVSYAF